MSPPPVLFLSAVLFLSPLAEAGYEELSFANLVRWFGVPGAMMAVFIVFLMRGYFVTAREAIQEHKAHDDRLQDLRNRYDADMKTFQERYGKMEDEKNYWRSLALRNMEALEKSQDTAKRAVDRLTPPDP